MIAWLAVILLLAAAVVMGGSGPAYRMEWISLGEAFTFLRRGAYLAIGAGAVGLVALIVAGFCRRWVPALVGGLVSVAVVGMMIVPLQMMQRSQSVPPIHDITTDLDNPPAFEALATAREAAPNSVDYPGEDTARQQREAYPAIQPIVFEQPLADVMQAAEETAQAQGWEIASVTENKIEATATTRWFGFKDDVVIRLTETDEGVRVDMRSASRFGASDVGTNAARIQAYLEALKSSLRG
ncbi:DUF1499 domain-containing protein [Pistricoccus aurantiacus]|uniref:DUF1499 domain-containing protein n=1 Tax=Pistricoccus aurantiacus TaxID=1883414 RepID=UPI0036430AE3